MWGWSLSARETVVTEIPNSLAISFIVNGKSFFIRLQIFNDAKILKKTKK
jgi:hypothetical protein